MYKELVPEKKKSWSSSVFWRSHSPNCWLSFCCRAKDARTIRVTKKDPSELPVKQKSWKKRALKYGGVEELVRQKEIRKKVRDMEMENERLLKLEKERQRALGFDVSGSSDEEEEIRVKQEPLDSSQWKYGPYYDAAGYGRQNGRSVSPEEDNSPSVLFKEKNLLYSRDHPYFKNQLGNGTFPRPDEDPRFSGGFYQGSNQAPPGPSHDAAHPYGKDRRSSYNRDWFKDRNPQPQIPIHGYSEIPLTNNVSDPPIKKEPLDDFFPLNDPALFSASPETANHPTRPQSYNTLMEENFSLTYTPGYGYFSKPLRDDDDTSTVVSTCDKCFSGVSHQRTAECGAQTTPAAGYSWSDPSEGYQTTLPHTETRDSGVSSDNDTNGSNGETPLQKSIDYKNPSTSTKIHQILQKSIDYKNPSTSPKIHQILQKSTDSCGLDGYFNCQRQDATNHKGIFS